MTVFITPLDDSLLTWLPLGGPFFALALFPLVLWARIAPARAGVRKSQ